MEFNEKLQQLRKQSGLTQEQLAESLFVTRAAVSKWESGKGYPSVDSLKSISKVFGVSIDDLLSSQELITIAQEETRSSVGKAYGSICSIIDMLAVAFIFLPIYGQREGAFIRSVPLYHLTSALDVMYVVYWVLIIAIFALGIAQAVARRLGLDELRARCAKVALLADILAIGVFIATQQPYAAMFLFLLLIIKSYILQKKEQFRI